MKTTRRLLIVLMSVIMVFAAGMTVACKKGNKDSSTSSSTEANDPLSGSFYCEAETADGTKVLIELEFKTDWSYTLKLDGNVLTGNYTVEGSDVTLDPVIDDVTAVKYYGDTVEIEYAGFKQTLIADVTYTVSFSGAGEGYTSVEVRNGTVLSKAVELVDPQKVGYRFVGWYTEAEYKNRVYPASYVVKGNVTLYAKFQAESAEGYAVKYYKGEEYLGEDFVADKVFPELKSDMGEDFLGWWMSDTLDSAKLTRQVKAGEALTEDTALYAVYKTDAPAVSVSSDRITWNAVANKTYDVVVTKPNGKTYTQGAIEAGELKYSFANESAGEYEIKVSCDGKTGFAYYVNKRLDRPSSLKVEGMELTFASVANAQSYSVNVNGQHTATLGNVLSYDISGLTMTADGLDIEVTAHADGYADSTSFVYHLERKLASVTGIAYSKGKVVWNAVEKATAYEVTVNGKTEVVTGTEYDVSELTGRLTVSVKALADGYYSPEATTVELAKNDLATPTGLKYVYKDNKERIEWNAVEGAVGYQLTVTGEKNGKNVTLNIAVQGDGSTTVRELALSDLVGLGGKNLVFALTAKAADPANNSSAATVTIKTSISDIGAEDCAYNNGTLTWPAIRRVAEYTVVLPDGTEVGTDEPAYSGITFNKAGENKITVKTNNGSFNYGVIAYAVTYTTSSTTVPTEYKALTDVVTLPETELARTGYTFSGWYDSANEELAEEIGKSFVMTTPGTVTIYAGWNPNEYILTLDVAGGAELADDEKEVTVKFRRTNAVFPVPAVGNDKSKLFYGWYTQPNGQGTRLTGLNGEMVKAYNNPYNATVYAYWLTAFEFEPYEKNADGSTKSYSVMAGPDMSKFDGEEVTVPAEYAGSPVRYVESNAFFSCKFRVLNLPQTIYTIELISSDSGSAFSNCSALEAINVYEVEGMLSQDIRYFSEDGVLYFEHEDAVTLYSNTEVAYVPRAKEGTLNISEKTEIIPMGVLGSIDGTSTTSSHKFTEVIVPHSVTKIEEKAFVSNYKLVKLEFLPTPSGEAEKELTIGQAAFSGCSHLEEVKFPARLSNFDATVFDGCTNILNVDIEAGNAHYSSIDGVMFNNSGESLIYFPRGRMADDDHPEYASYTVPAKVTTIRSNAFSGAKINEVVIGANVIEIEPYAFSGTTDGKAYSGMKGNYKGTSCYYLERIIFEDGTQPLTIGEGAFYGSSTSFVELTLPARLAVLGDYAFGGKTKLTTVNLEADLMYTQGTEFDYSTKAFVSTSNQMYIETLNIGAKVPASINIAGIFGSRALKTVNISKENKNFKEEDQVIYNREMTRVVYYLDSREGAYVLPDSVTVIEAGTFKQRDGLTEISIHAGVTYIGDEAFYNCKNLVKVTMADGGENAEELNLGNGVFKSCFGLLEIKLSNRTRKIGSELFKGCSRLTEVEIPEGVTELGDEAFSGITEYSVNAFTTIKLPSTLVKFGSYEKKNDVDTLVSINAFLGCNSLAEIIVAEGNTKFFTYDGVLYVNTYDAKYDKEVKQLVVCPAAKAGSVNVPADVTKVWANAFSNNIETTEVNFEDSTMEDFALEIGENAFKGCKKLVRLNLPAGLTEIATNTFKECTSLETIEIPYTVTNIAVDAFVKCTSLKTLTFTETPEGVAEVGLSIADGKYSESHDSSSGGQPSFTLNSAFNECTSLTEIEFPERMTYLGEHTFRENKTIKKVVFPSTITSIGQNAFYNAVSLEEVIFRTNAEGKTSLKEIPYRMFSFGVSSPSALKSVTLPEGLEAISAYAFAYCKELTTITIPSTVVEIGKAVKVSSYSTAVGSAFANCKKLTNVTFAENGALTVIRDDSFLACNLTSVKIPATVEEIGVRCFADNKKLTSIQFLTAADEGNEQRSALKSIGDYAFRSTALTEFVLPETPDTVSLGIQMFKDCYDIGRVYLSSRVAKIENVFDNCKSEYIIEVSEDNENLKAHKTLPVIIGETKVTDESGKEITLITVKFAYRQIMQDVLELPENCIAIESNALALQQYITKVILPASIQSIADGAFHDCHMLKEVVFKLDENNETQLQTLGTSANKFGVFQNCYSLSKIVLPNVVINGSSNYSGGVLFDKTFYQCASAETVDVTPAVSEIEKLGDGIYLPASLTALGTKTGQYSGSGYGVFQGCIALESVVLPASLTALNDGTFAKCTSLSSISYKGAAANAGNVISNKVKTIGTYMFENCTSLRSLTLPSELTLISHSMFRGSGIESIVIPGKVTKIGNPSNVNASMAFKDAVNLREVVFEDVSKLTVIGASTFENTAISSIDISGATSIGTKLFFNCKNLTDVKFNSGLKEIPSSVFEGCTSLTGVKMTASGTPERDEKGNYIYTLELPADLYYLGTAAFKNSGIIAIRLPEGVKALCNSNTVAKKFAYGNYNVTAEQFLGCANLEWVEFASAPGLIGKNAFLDCVSLQGIVAPDADRDGALTEDGFSKGLIGIGDCAFKNSGIRRVTLNSLQRVGKELFMNSALEEAYIGKDVRYGTSNASGWGASMFEGCANLKGIKFDDEGNRVIDETTKDYVYTVSLPDKAFYYGTYTFRNSGLIALKFGPDVTMIGNNSSKAGFTGNTAIFAGCVDLEKVTFEGSDVQLCNQVFKDCGKLSVVKGLEKAKYIGNDAFAGTAVKELSFDSNVTIGTGAFQNCEELEKVTFSDKVKSIGASAFFSCDSLSTIELSDSITTLGANCFAWAPISGTVKLPEKLTSFGNGAFFGCSGIENFEISGGSTAFATADGVMYNKDMTKLVSIPAGRTKALDISGVKEIGSYAFAYCDKLEGITMPAALEKVNSYAFACMDIPETIKVTLSEGMTEIPEGLFEYSTGLGNVVLPSTIKTIGKKAFYHAEFTGINLPEGVETIGESAFEGAKCAGKVVLPSTVSKMGKQAFMNAEFASITFTDGMSDIGISAFEGAKGLSKVKLPDGLKVLNNRSFYGSDVESVEMPESLYAINNYVFQNCEALTSVTFTGKLEEIGTEAFSGTGLTSVFIPKSVQLLGTKSFAENKSLTKVEFEEGTERVGNFSSIKLTSPAQGKQVTYSSSTSMFLNSALETIVIPDSVSVISSNAFQNNNLTAPVWPASLTKVNASVYQGNPLTGKLEIPERITEIGKYAFAGAERTAVLDDEGNETGEYDYTGCASVTEIVLPAGYVTIEEGTFANQYSLAKINLENVQKFAGSLVLAYAGILNEKGLELTFSALNNDVSATTDHAINNDGTVKTIGKGPFSYANIAKMTFTDEAAIRARLLHSLEKVPELVFPEGVTSLPSRFYAFCLAEEITVPAGIEMFGDYAFQLCLNLKKLTFAEGSVAREAGTFAFSECPKLETLVLPETFQAVGTWAFKFDFSLKNLYLPSQLQISSTNCFAGFGADQTVHFGFTKAERYRYLVPGYDIGGTIAGQECNARFVFSDENE